MDERTNIVVLAAANGIFKIWVDSSHTAGPCTALVVKYIAKSAAKNINSDASQTIVPTATRFGRLTRFTVPAYVVIWVIIPEILHFGSIVGRPKAFNSG
jgi:hypothetical protein